MKKITSFLTFLFLTSIIVAQNNGDYTLIINNDSIQIDLNKLEDFKTSDGEILKVRIVQADIQTYIDDMISFKYDKSISISNSIIEEGIEQCMGMESTGNGFIIQKYKNFDPTGLNNLMLNEITKESVSYGYSKTEKSFKKKLKNGEELKGTQATLMYKGEREVYTVASYGGKDEGILVILMLLDVDSNYNEIVDLLLDTLEIL